MNDTAIKNFCTWARNALIEQVETRMRRFSVVEANTLPEDATSVDGVPLSPDEQRQRAELLRLQREVGHAALAERAAYTWFNRLVAIRFMELHDYLPCRVRMLSADDGSFAPQVLKCALDVQIEGLDAARVMELMQAGDDEALFRCLFLAQCDELSSCIPGVFDRVGSAMELLLPDGLLRQDSVLDRLVTSIPEEDWERVEILGWMYQYYNAEVKDAFFKSKAKETPDTIGPATQLFTPEWIVRYMVENSLGRLWMLNFPESTLCQKWDYYIAPDAEHEDFIRIDGPEDITLCDPACGSGHILVYAFQLLFDMYVERGYREREIPQLILEKNLAGMEIDPRAAQIANLALAMCAREHDRRFFGRGVQADVLVVAPTKFQRDEAGNVIELSDDAAIMADQQFIDALEHLGEVGSLLNPTEAQLEALRTDAARFAAEAEGGSLFGNDLGEKLQDALRVCEALARKFDCVVANPPYMGSSSFSSFMSKWIKKNYPDVKSDLFSSFIVRIMDYANERGEAGIMCPFVWMFIGSYEKLREKMINEKTITSLVQLEYSGFAGATVPICTFTFHNSYVDEYKGGYVRLSDFVGAAVQAPKTREAIANPDCGYFYRRNAKTFTQIPGTPIAYWIGAGAYRAFKNGISLMDVAKTRKGMFTGNNDRFLRFWHEVSSGPIGADYKFYSKGGSFRRWYGNRDYVVRWSNNGEEIKAYPGSGNINEDDYFKPCLCWSLITSGDISFRSLNSAEFVVGDAGPACYPLCGSSRYLLGLLNSSPIRFLSKAINPTLNWSAGVVGSFPVLQCETALKDVDMLVDELQFHSKLDWDSFETSWDFKRHPLL
ncbi:BREX-1 system adenine-specific DNA-methyltransferase PglX [uncultured Ellagibacter sp.]|uniref:BREX-1 system adenine-specific DNA-methyltransferase PglX n=1 Tax=uncultured Ellagibacter sp. TaxID=2137580 RepID=UPI00260A86A5|nr:BREX-1 system adenine-specific DNA-methyltransferase PglX [uncultured Ellagibacter sp.]